VVERRTVERRTESTHGLHQRQNVPVCCPTFRYKYSPIRIRKFVNAKALVVDIASTRRIDAFGRLTTYPACQDYAASRRTAGVTMLRTPSAALLPGAARGEVTDAGLREGPNRDGHVWVLFGRHPGLCGWRAVERGRPAARLLPLVRTLT
jgi:hypothetical protein